MRESRICLHRFSCMRDYMTTNKTTTPDDDLSLFLSVFNAFPEIVFINRLKRSTDKDEEFCKIIGELKSINLEERRFIISTLLRDFETQLNPKIVRSVLAALDLT